MSPNTRNRVSYGVHCSSLFARFRKLNSELKQIHANTYTLMKCEIINNCRLPDIRGSPARSITCPPSYTMASSNTRWSRGFMRSAMVVGSSFMSRSEVIILDDWYHNLIAGLLKGLFGNITAKSSVSQPMGTPMWYSFHMFISIIKGWTWEVISIKLWTEFDALFWMEKR